MPLLIALERGLPLKGRFNYLGVRCSILQPANSWNVNHGACVHSQVEFPVSAGVGCKIEVDINGRIEFDILPAAAVHCHPDECVKHGTVLNGFLYYAKLAFLLARLSKRDRAITVASARSS